MTAIPGDLDRPDRFLFGLTLRQLALLAPLAVLLALAGWLGAGRVPLVVLLPAMAVLAGAGISLTLIRQDGMAPEALVRVFLGYACKPRKLFWHPGKLPGLPKALHLGSKSSRAGRFTAPWRGFSGKDLDLGDDGRVRVLAVSSLDLQLRSERETTALTGGFSRLLNALDESLCVLVRGEPVDLEAQAASLEKATTGAPASLSAYAADHADLLRSMSGGLRRRVYLVVKGRDSDALDARCGELLTLLRPMGLSARELQDCEAVALLARASAQPVPDRAAAANSEPVRSTSLDQPGEVPAEGGRHGWVR